MALCPPIVDYSRLQESGVQKYENTTPPKFLQGDREFNHPPPEGVDHFKGIPASQGVLTATVRVLESIRDYLAGTDRVRY